MASAATAFTITEIGRNTMVLAYSLQKWLEDRRKRRIEAAVQAGEAKGRAQNQRLWEEWLARWEETEARGEDFTEPPPNGTI